MKYKRISRAMVFLLAVIMVYIGAVSDVLAADSIKLIINGRELTGLTSPPIIYQESVLVPAREVFESMGAAVEWRAGERSVYITYKENTLVMTIDKKTAKLNGVDKTMTVPPRIVNDKTMIPLRFPSECFGFEVAWKSKERAAHIDVPPDIPPAAEEPPVTEPVIPIPGVDPGISVTEPSNPGTDPGTTITEPFNPGTDPGTTITEPFNPGTDPGTSGTDPSNSGVDPGTSVTEPFIPGASGSPSNQTNGTIVRARDVSPYGIEKGDYPETVVTGLLTPRETMNAGFVIMATSPISEVGKLLLEDNRLVIDIYNARCELLGSYATDPSVPVTGIRASQFMTVPMITRVVFDLTGAAEYSVTLSADRKSLTVSFAQNSITDIGFATTGILDTITITGVSTPIINVIPLTNPDRIAIYINNASIDEPVSEIVDGLYAVGIHTSMTDGGLGCIEVLLREFPSYNIDYAQGRATVSLYPNTYKNIAYDRASHTFFISKTSGLQMDINQILHTDYYNNNRYILSLPVNAEAAIGYGEMNISDGYINSVSIARDERGLTQLYVNEAQILAFTVHEDNEYYYIKANLPRELYKYIVVVDPGHGGSDPGAIQLGINEKDVNLGIGLKLMQLLDVDPDIKAYATRTTDVFILKENRPVFANPIGDIFVSIHSNSAKNNTVPNGTETYYWPHSNDYWLGYTSQQLADTVHRNLVQSLGSTDRKVRSTEYVVLRDTTIPAILCEIGFLTNPPEAFNLSTDSYQWQAAAGLYRGIKEAFMYYTPAR